MFSAARDTEAGSPAAPQTPAEVWFYHVVKASLFTFTFPSRAVCQPVANSQGTRKGLPKKGEVPLDIVVLWAPCQHAAV